MKAFHRWLSANGPLNSPKSYRHSAMRFHASTLNTVSSTKAGAWYMRSTSCITGGSSKWCSGTSTRLSPIRANR
ncbi:hypothetical protein RLIN73S_04215 [Rhodanobacter lindaniclasticus]